MLQHNHMTRDIKPEGVCPKCDEQHHRQRDIVSRLQTWSQQGVNSPGILLSDAADHIMKMEGERFMLKYEIAKLRAKLYDVLCGTSDDPDDYGLELDHTLGRVTVKPSTSDVL